MKTYYNEFDPKAAAWLKELISAGHIPKGDVDERSILDVTAADLAGYDSCHFFAGIGGWPYALRLAGWPADRPAWSGSCPCQPFSCAGNGMAEADERHLWPFFRNLIGHCRPATVFGEQVASSLGRVWLTGVRSDLEALAYAVGAAAPSAAGVGAPHIRKRIYWVANARRSKDRWVQDPHDERGQRPSDLSGGTGGDGGLAYSEHNGGRTNQSRREPQRRETNGRDLEAVRLVDAAGRGQRTDGIASGKSGHAEQREQSGGMGKPILSGLERHAGNGDNGNQPGRNGTQPVGSIAETGNSCGLHNTAQCSNFSGVSQFEQPSMPGWKSETH